MLDRRHLTLRYRETPFHRWSGMEVLLRFVEGSGLDISNTLVPITDTQHDGYLETHLGLVHARFATLIVDTPRVRGRTRWINRTKSLDIS